MMQNRNQGLANQGYSNITADEAIKMATAAAEKLKGTVGEIKGIVKPKSDSQPEKGGAPYTPPVKSETLIFGMHPITLMIGSVAVLLLGALSVVTYKHFNK